MKRLVSAIALTAAPVLAQPPATPTPEQQALGATVMACVQESVGLRTQIFTLQAEVERLKAAAKVSSATDPPKVAADASKPVN